ncbi:MAG: ATP-binding protein [Cellvibrio sp.]
MKTSQLSIRMTLLMMAGVLNILIAMLVGHRAYKSWDHYQQAERLKQGIEVINAFYTANKNLSQARASTLSMMYSDADVAEPLYQDLLKNRQAVDKALAMAFAGLTNRDMQRIGSSLNQLKNKYDTLLKRRAQIDIELSLPVATRNRVITNLFFEENTALIAEIQDFILIYSRSYQGIDATISQHMVFEYFVWDLAEYAGEEYAIIGQMLAENKHPTQWQRDQLLFLRARIEYGWAILRKFALNEELAEQLFPLMEEASTQYFFTFDQVSDLFYGNHPFGAPASYPISSTLWLGMSAQAVDSLLILQNEILSEIQKRANNIEDDAASEISASGLIFLCALLISLYSWVIIAYRVARPVNAMVNALYKATHENIFEIPTIRYQHEEIGKLLHVLQVFQHNAQKMKESNEELERFAFIAAHDLKSPLRAVDNISQWLEEDLEDVLPAASRIHLDEMRKRIRLMDKMLDDTLEYARVDAKIDSHANDIVSGKILIDEIVGLIDLPPGFTITTGDTLAKLKVQKLPLQQVLFNLINNGVKHHDKNQGKVIVDVVEHEAEFIFTVQDDGPGIDPQFHQKIFEMFQTLQPREKSKGRGMGLAMVRKIIIANGGTINVESAAGEGALFRFTWPK